MSRFACLVLLALDLAEIDRARCLDRGLFNAADVPCFADFRTQWPQGRKAVF